MVACLCVWAYTAFFPIVRYSHEPYSTAWLWHLLAISALWINTVWNYCLCAAVDPGYVAAAATVSTPIASEPMPTASIDGGGTTSIASRTATKLPPTSASSSFPDGTQLCRICNQRVLHFDHHCPFTGGCVGAYNLRFFCLFVLHCFLGCGWACHLAWPPFRDCVVNQMSVPRLGLSRRMPPDELKCIELGARSLLLLPALMLCASLGLLGGFHLLLLRSGLTTLQFTRRWRREGLRSVRDLVLSRGEAETNKMHLIFGNGAAGGEYGVHRGGVGSASSSYGPFRVVRILTLPSLPLRRKLSPGVGSNRSWLGAAFTLAALFLVLPLVSGALESAGHAMRSTMADAVKGLATIPGQHGAHHPF